MTEPGAERSSVSLSDEAVVLRPWISSDANFMIEASRDPAIERYNGPTPASVADAVAVIERIQESWRAFEEEGDPSGVAFAIIDDASDEPVGMCGIDHWSSTDVAQFGYWLAAGARGRGFATRAVTLMTSWLFELGAARVFLTIQSDNAASAAVARRAGFTYEGTLRGHGVWQGQRQDRFGNLRTAIWQGIATLCTCWSIINFTAGARFWPPASTWPMAVLHHGLAQDLTATLAGVASWGAESRPTNCRSK